jgi:hypothetical protein
MIVFELICASQHRFEGWFASHDDFDRQQKSRVLECPVCATTNIAKLPAAKIRTVASSPPEVTQPKEQVAVAQPDPAAMMASLIDHVLRHTEDVGQAFAAEARKIHNAETPARGIRGVANREEVAQLLDDGIEVMPLPIPAKRDWH